MGNPSWRTRRFWSGSGLRRRSKCIVDIKTNGKEDKSLRKAISGWSLRDFFKALFGGGR